jgi:hypothetical protein
MSLQSAHLTPRGSGMWDIVAEFDQSSCRPDPLIASSDQFSVARMQPHRPLPNPKPMILTDKPPQVNLPNR